MADRDKAKQRQRLKREQKRREHAKRTQQHGRTLAWATGPAECYITEDWRERGIGNLMILREGPKGSWAFAGFLIDTFCIGLKDTHATAEYTPSDFEEVMDRASEDQEFALISLDEAKALVSAAVRWSGMHHFRLPKGWEKAASIFGDLGDIGSADVSMFGWDGGLHYIGLEEDLVARLTTETLEQFMARPGVQVTFFEGEEDEEVPDEEMFAAMAAGMAEQSREMADAVRQWCFRVGRIPQEHIDIACEFVNLALMQAVLEVSSIEDAHISKTHERILSQAEEADRTYPQNPPIRPAVAQVIEFVQSPEGQALISELANRDMEEDE